MIIDERLMTITSAVQWLIHNQQPFWERSLVVISILAHILDARQNIWSKILAFPITFISIYVYSVRGLYGKVTYNVIFIFFNIYAYLKWKGNNHRQPLQVSRTSHAMLLYIIGIGLLGALGWGFIVGKGSLSMYGDACYLSFGFMDKWLMAHKKLERWMIALFRYICFSLACYHAGATILSMHYLALSCIAIYGQIKWYLSYRAMRTQ